MTSYDRDQATALAAGGALLAAVLWPVRQNWRTERVDGFPLSYYPMFSAKRRRTGTVVHLLGLDAQGGRHLLPHDLVGPGGLNQVRRQIAREARLGRAQRVADRVAGRVARSRPEVVEVLVVSGTYRYDDFFAGSREPRREVVHARAAVADPLRAGAPAAAAAALGAMTAVAAAAGAVAAGARGDDAVEALEAAVDAVAQAVAADVRGPQATGPGAGVDRAEDVLADDALADPLADALAAAAEAAPDAAGEALADQVPA